MGKEKEINLPLPDPNDLMISYGTQDDIYYILIVSVNIDFATDHPEVIDFGTAKVMYISSREHALLKTSEFSVPYGWPITIKGQYLRSQFTK